MTETILCSLSFVQGEEWLSLRDIDFNSMSFISDVVKINSKLGFLRDSAITNV